MTMMKYPLLPRVRALVAFAALGFAAPALSCTVSVVGVSFGAIDPLGAGAIDSTGQVSVTCDPGGNYQVELGAGTGSYAQREMTGPGSGVLDYNLYTDVSRSVVWGDGTVGSAVVSGSDGGAGTTHTVYGRIPASQSPVAGSYADNIIVTVVF